MTFSFHRGTPALDFVGTVGARASGSPEERLPGPADLGRWLGAAGLGDHLAPTARDLAAAVALREAIHRAAGAVLSGRAIGRADLGAINRAAAGLRLGAPRLTAALAVRWRTAVPVALALARLAADAIDLLARRAGRLTRCELPGCGALLLAGTRGAARRWCSMERCGNRAKVAAFRRRQARG